MKKALIVALSLVLVMVIGAIVALSLIVFGIEDEPQVEVVESVQPVEDSFSWEGMTQEEVLQQMLMYGSVYISEEDSEIWLNDAIRNVENSNFEYRKTMLDIL